MIYSEATMLMCVCLGVSQLYTKNNDVLQRGMLVALFNRARFTPGVSEK